MNGKMAEWSIASDLKSDVLNGTVSSNLTLSFYSSVTSITTPFPGLSFCLMGPSIGFNNIEN
jgi:hypothetical protein